jgi:membrane protease YdiL (CAAX protease family)
MTGRAVGWGELLFAGLLITGVATLGVPAPTAVRLPLPGAVAAGAAAGAGLFRALSGAWCRAPSGSLRSVALCGPAATLVGRAAVEEVAWRGFALPALAGALTVIPALAATSTLFALAHTNVEGRERLVHVGTGVAFGGLYLLTGRLAAAISAHVVYNGLIAIALVAATPPGARGGTR